MGELWRDLVELLRKHPALWLPVLFADLLSYFLNVGRNASLKALVLHQTMQRSALGGAVVQTPMSASAMQTTTILALLLSWFTYFLRILLYSGALVATAALVFGYLRRQQSPASAIGSWLASHWGGMLDLALRALALYAVAALFFSLLSSFLLKHGYTAVLRNALFGIALGLILLLLLSATLPPVALRVLAGVPPPAKLASDAQQFSAILALAVTVLAAFVSANNREMIHLSAGVRMPLEILGSLVVALPYVLLFTGLSIMASRLAADNDETAA